ncbi:MAG: nucleotidyltransferase family protein [Hellea sp.]
MKPENCALIILASGLSERFGTADKLMVDFRGKPLVQHVIDAAKDVRFARRFAVIPRLSKRRRALFSGQDFTLIENDTPEAGQGGSLKLAAQAARDDGYSAICVMLGDMPFVQTADLINLLRNLSGKDRGISHCNNTLMPPAIFTNEALDALLSLDPDSGAKALFNSEDFYKHPLSERAARDIDTPETLAELT